MDPNATNPASEAPATPPQAGAGTPAESGSRYRTGMLVSVPHPDIPLEEDHPAGQEPSEPKPPAGRPARERSRPGPVRQQQEPFEANLQEGGAGEDPASDGQPGGGQEAPAPYKVLDYRGRQVPVKDEAELVRLAQQGFDYTVKTQMLAPHLNDLRALAAVKADPTRASQLQALLTGQPINEGMAPSQQPPAAKLPVIYVRDKFGNIVHGENGQPVQADPTFVHAIKDYVEALGLDGKPAPAGLPPELAGMVTQAQVGKVAAYVKQTYGREDFTAAIPMIQEAMVAQGITAGDPRDNPNTWLSIYNHLALTNQLPAAGQAAPGFAAPGGQPTSKRVNKSDIKAAAQTPQPNNIRDGGKDLDAAIARAKEQGSSTAWQKAVSLAISHPDLER